MDPEDILERLCVNDRYATDNDILNLITKCGEAYLGYLFETAIENGNMRILRMFVEKYKQKIFNSDYNPLFSAIDYNQLEVVVYLIREGIRLENSSITCLWYAIYEKKYDMVTLIVKLKPELQYGGNGEDNPLLWAIEENHPEVVDALFDGDAVMYSSYAICQPIHIAVYNNRILIVKLFIRYGCDLEVKDNRSYTPLHCAVLDGYVEMTRVLLKAGANVKAFDRDGNSPLDLAKNMNHTKIINLLIHT